MKTYLASALLLFLFQATCFSQEVKSTRIGETRKIRVDHILYNKQSGEKMTGEDLALLLKENPGLQLIPEFNRFGQVERYFYDPLNPNFETKRDPNKRPKQGESFPKFTFRTTQGETFSSEDLADSWVIIQFLINPNRLNEDSLEKLDLEIKELQELEIPIYSFLVFSYEHDLGPMVDKYHSSFYFVQNGWGYNEMFHISKFPSTFLINPKGEIVKYFEGFDLVEILPYIKRK